jgi:hypothetical protein
MDTQDDYIKQLEDHITELEKWATLEYDQRRIYLASVYQNLINKVRFVIETTIECLTSLEVEYKSPSSDITPELMGQIRSKHINSVKNRINSATLEIINELKASKDVLEEEFPRRPVKQNEQQ